MPAWINISRTVDGKTIPGTYLWAFIHNGDYFLTEIKIYADGFIDCWGLIDFEGFKDKVRSGWVVTKIPEGARVSIHGLALFDATNVIALLDPEDFINEVADEISQLNGRGTAGQRCKEVYDKYVSNPSEEFRKELKTAYEAVPKNLRRYLLGDMDLKDTPIRMIVYGQQEVESWTHRIVSRALGLDPLPKIDVPNPPEKQDN